MSEPSFRLGESRADPRRRLTFRQRIRSWFGGRPAVARLDAIPKPPRSVLMARTLAEDTREDSGLASSRRKSTKRK